jgi:hypothetical protein
MVTSEFRVRWHDSAGGLGEQARLTQWRERRASGDAMLYLPSVPSSYINFIIKSQFYPPSACPFLLQLAELSIL